MANARKVNCSMRLEIVTAIAIAALLIACLLMLMWGGLSDGYLLRMQAPG